MKTRIGKHLALWLGATFLVFAGHLAQALQVPGPLVDTDWLAAHQDAVVVLDIRKAGKSFAAKPKPVKAKAGEAAKKPKLNLKRLTGHIPGAVPVPWKKIFSKSKIEGGELKAMLPSQEAFQALMRASGVNADSAVVVVGRAVNVKELAHAARLYFTLKYFGHDNVALLDGGVAKWAKEGRPLAYDVPEPAPGNFSAGAGRPELLASIDEVTQAVQTGSRQLVDGRPQDFYLGLTYMPIFVAPHGKGHLPGAVSWPMVLNADNSGPAVIFDKPVQESVAALQGVELDRPTTAYCNTGVVGALTWFVMREVLGMQDVDLYDGSMHEWSQDETRPVEGLQVAAK
jgi:thiosulfate/3-mercaptopyruvate sulfurtransferase